MQVLEKISLTPIWVIATLLDEFLGVYFGFGSVPV